MKTILFIIAFILYLPFLMFFPLLASSLLFIIVIAFFYFVYSAMRNDFKKDKTPKNICKQKLNTLFESFIVCLLSVLLISITFLKN